MQTVSRGSVPVRFDAVAPYPAAACDAAPGRSPWRRRLLQAGFFALFVLAPPLDLLRFDLHAGHAVILGQPWTLGVEGLAEGWMGSGAAALSLLLRVFLPVLGAALLFLWLARRFGRLYCGWLCPHFSMVELINGLMRRASARPSLWERERLPARRAGGYEVRSRALWWLPTIFAILAVSALWAVTLLTWLLPPAEVYGNLLHGSPTRNQAIFLVAATAAFAVEFTLARHLFCRFGCAVGLFQSLAWMSNSRGMVVGFDADRAAACRACDSACDHACPMRLKPRAYKRAKFTCTQCGECIRACEVVQGDARRSLLGWRFADVTPERARSLMPRWKNR